jgi:hypothetical protein
VFRLSTGISTAFCVGKGVSREPPICALPPVKVEC